MPASTARCNLRTAIALACLAVGAESFVAEESNPAGPATDRITVHTGDAAAMARGWDAARLEIDRITITSLHPGGPRDPPEL